MDLATTYSLTIAALGALTALMLCQLLVADITGLRSGHLPGSQVPANHDHASHRVAAALAREEPYREALLLRFFEELPPRRIAQQLSVPVSPVHTRLTRVFDPINNDPNDDQRQRDQDPARRVMLA